MRSEVSGVLLLVASLMFSMEESDAAKDAYQRRMMIWEEARDANTRARQLHGEGSPEHVEAARHWANTPGRNRSHHHRLCDIAVVEYVKALKFQARREHGEESDEFKRACADWDEIVRAHNDFWLTGLIFQ